MTSLWLFDQIWPTLTISVSIKRWHVAAPSFSQIRVSHMLLVAPTALLVQVRCSCCANRGLCARGIDAMEAWAATIAAAGARLLPARGADRTVVWTTKGARHWCGLLLLPLYIWFVLARGEGYGGATAFLLVMVALLHLHRACDVNEGWRWCRFWLVSLLNAWRPAVVVLLVWICKAATVVAKQWQRKRFQSCGGCRDWCRCCRRDPWLTVVRRWKHGEDGV